MAGLTRFDPAGRHENAVPPRLVVESAGLPTRSIAYPAALDLGWRERTIDFRVAVLAFRNHARAAFRARLDGLENAWLPLRRPGELRYTNLSPGSYRLLLQAANESGVWAEEVALPIRVHPPWWQTVWFRVTAAAAALALAVGAEPQQLVVLQLLVGEGVVAQRQIHVVGAEPERAGFGNQWVEIPRREGGTPLAEQ